MLCEGLMLGSACAYIIITVQQSLFNTASMGQLIPSGLHV